MTAGTTVHARPVKSSRIAVIAAAVVLVVFTLCALVLPNTAGGVQVDAADQVGIGGTGLLVALGILAFTRPRLHADAAGVNTRAFFGGYRHVDWDLVTAVEFPHKVRFARLVLPADELVVLYAVQRGDGERSVEVMQGLRALFAASRAGAAPGDHD
jgi:hypothetical protein